MADKSAEDVMRVGSALHVVWEMYFMRYRFLDSRGVDIAVFNSSST
jgi:hypothetical protein